MTNQMAIIGFSILFSIWQQVGLLKIYLESIIGKYNNKDLNFGPKTEISKKMSIFRSQKWFFLLMYSRISKVFYHFFNK